MIDGLKMLRSRSDAVATAARAMDVLPGHGLTLIARVDHAAAAARVDLPLGPTEVLLFGNPRGGTPLMQAARTIAIDLPLRMLVWTDDGGGTWVGYDDPLWLARRHGVPVDHPAVDHIDRVLAAIADHATSAV